jgi:hypothetical protein
MLPEILRERRQSLDHAVAIGGFDDPLDPLHVVPKRQACLFQGRSFAEICHIQIVPFPLLEANFGRFVVALPVLTVPGKYWGF